MVGSIEQSSAGSGNVFGMRRKDKKSRTKQAAFGVKRLIAAKLAEEYAEDPEAFSYLAEMGLVDEAALRNLPDDMDFAGMVTQFRHGIAEMARSEPSVLERLELRPLDIFLSAEEPAVAVSQAPLSVVFSDLEGFTAYTSLNGDLEASAMLRDHYDTVESIVRGRGGSVVKTIGDGHMLSFGQSQAAVLAGAELADVLAGQLRVRVGGHNGNVVKTPDDIVGHVVNVAARVTDVASGGEFLVTTALRDTAGSVRGLEFDAPTATELHGLENPVEVCRVLHRLAN
jgi:adenylate cyclase